MKNYSEIAERQADHVIAEAQAGRFHLLDALIDGVTDEALLTFLLDHCEEALIRMYDEETEAQKDAYAKGDR